MSDKLLPRHIIEIINVQLKNQSQIEHSRHRRPKRTPLCASGYVNSRAYSTCCSQPKLFVWITAASISNQRGKTLRQGANT